MKTPFSRLFQLAIICLFCCSFSSSQTEIPFSVSGRVHDELDRPLESVRVCAVAEGPSRNASCGVSTATGEFVIRLPGAGRYQLFPDKTQDGYFPQWQAFFRNPLTSITKVRLNDLNRIASVSILVGPKNGMLRGKSQDVLTGLPIENVTFLLCHAGNSRVCWGTNAKNPAGEFNLLVSHVPFTLKVSADGYEDWFGLTGSDKDGSISVASGTVMELNPRLRRRAEATVRALSEAEKQPYMNLPAPIQLTPEDRTEFNYYPRLTRLEWQPVDGAASYNVEVDYCDGRMKNRRECLNPQPHRTDKQASGILTTSYEFNFVGAQPGRWRVWAVDKNGQEGFKSPWRLFFYLK